MRQSAGRQWWVGGLMVAATVGLTGGCTWVKLSPQAEDVTVARPEHVQHCRRVGQTTVHTTDMVGGVSRGAETVNEELRRLARNAAAQAGADTVVPIGEPWWGEQRFDMYRCRP